MKRLLLGVGLTALASAAHAQLFTPNGSFSVQTNAAPLSASGAADLTTGVTQVLLSNGLDLNVSITPGTDRAGAEWLVFQYKTSNGGAISPSTGDWSVNEVGLPLTKASFLIRGALQFDVMGTNAAFNSSPFGNLNVVSSMPADLSGILSGPGLLGNVNPDMNPADAFQPGPLGALGTFLNPFSQLSFGGGVTPDEITSYTEALEFAPVNATPTVPEAPTWAMLIMGFMGLAVGAAARRRLRMY